MAWIESHQSLGRHRKTLRVAALLGISRFEVIGHLQELWWWGLDNVPSDGCLGDLLDVEIAAAAGWEGEPGIFTEALMNAGGEGRPGFLELRDGRRYLHDWHDYAGKLLDRRESERERARVYRALRQPIADVRSTLQQRTQDVAETYEATVPNRTVPDPTQPLTSLANASDGVITPPKPIPKLKSQKPGDEKSKRPSYTAGQRLFLDNLDRKRFATRIQAQAVADLERDVGFEVLSRAVTWAAKNSIRMFSSIETTARKMAGGGTKTGLSPPERLGETVVREAFGTTAPSLREFEESGRLRSGFFAKQPVVKQEVGE